MVNIIMYSIKVTGYCGGVVSLLTSTASSYCNVALSALKTTQYEANDIGKHWKSREVHNSRGCELTEAATTQFFIRNLTLRERFSPAAYGHCMKWPLSFHYL